MQRRGEMRAGDSDREAVAERLRVAVNEGRLDLYEYDERLQQAYAAKTYAELDGLLRDLPDPAAPERAQRAVADGAGALVPDPLPPVPDGRYPGATRRWLVEHWGPYLSVVGTVTAIWATVSIMAWDLLYFWPIWVAGPWGAVLVVVTIGALVRGEPQQVAAQRARKKVAKQARRQRPELAEAADSVESEQTAESEQRTDLPVPKLESEPG